MWQPNTVALAFVINLKQANDLIRLRLAHKIHTSSYLMLWSDQIRSCCASLQCQSLNANSILNIHLFVAYHCSESFHHNNRIFYWFELRLNISAKSFRYKMPIFKHKCSFDGTKRKYPQQCIQLVNSSWNIIVRIDDKLGVNS